MFLTLSGTCKSKVLWVGLTWLTLASIQRAQAEGLEINSTFQTGVDVWAISPRQPNQVPFSFKGSDYEDQKDLILPDSDTKWNYRSVSPWMRMSSSIRLSSTFEANLKVRADQLLGAHVDVANIDWAPSPYLGLRAGVVNFNTNWCRTYDVDSPWIAEPDVFCRSNASMRVNNAAPGLQVYNEIALGDYQMQSIVGAYRPRLYGYETEEFGFNTDNLRSNFKRDSNQKISAAVNFVNLKTGTQLRLGMMHSDQAGHYSPRLSSDDRARHNLVDNYYLGIDTYLRPSLRLRYSASQFFSRDFYDDVLIIRDKDKSESMELIYEWTAADQWALGWSRFTIAASLDDAAFKKNAENSKAEDFYSLSNSSLQMSWRHQWGKGIYSIVQWTHAAQINGYYGSRRTGSGDAVGVRLAYQY
jgi:hypothetical protein